MDIPADFSLIISYDNGPLPPPYHSEYTLYLGPNSFGQIDYKAGYDNYTPQTLSKTFKPHPEIINDLYTIFIEQRLFERTWHKNQPLLGGSSLTIRVTANNHENFIPDWATMVPTDREIIDTIHRLAKSVIPKEIWDMIDELQQKHEKGCEENHKRV